MARLAAVIDANVLFRRYLRDTMLEPLGVKAVTANRFLLMLYERDPSGLVAAVLRQHENYRKHPRPFDDLLDKLAKVVPGPVTKIKQHLTGVCQFRGPS